MERCDVIVVGAGSVGCAVARELSQYHLDVVVLEKESDVAYGTSGRNSAVVHAGFNNRPGSLMAKLCVEGNRGFETLCRDLDVPYQKTGKPVIAFDEMDMEALRKILHQGELVGCEGLRLISREELHTVAPNVGGIGAMLSPNTAIFDPFLYCVALAENAAENGVQFAFHQQVTKIEQLRDGFCVYTPNARYRCRFLVNCAGLYCDEVSKMAGVSGYQIYPCRGEYFILDQVASELLTMPAYPVPRLGIGGLGVHLTPTVHGNLIIGPSAEYIDSRNDYACTKDIMEKLFREAKQLLPTLDWKQIIGNYSGIRPKQAPPGEGGFRDFVIKEEDTCPGLINLIGIESPGLTASAPIARIVRQIIGKRIALNKKQEYIATRKGIRRFRECSVEEQMRLIEEDAEYGEIICRCQTITKREIREAIENPLGARSLTSIKYRAWPMTGRCNGGYCLTRIVDMLVREYGIRPEEILYRSAGSELFRER